MSILSPPYVISNDNTKEGKAKISHFTPSANDRSPIGTYPTKIKNAPERIYVSFGSRRERYRSSDLVINENQAIKNSSNKYRMRSLIKSACFKELCISSEILSNFIYIDDTNVEQDYINIAKLYTDIGPPPYIIKPIQGSGGNEIKYIDSINTFIDVALSLSPEADSYLVEEYIKNSDEYRFHIFPLLKNQTIYLTYNVRDLQNPSKVYVKHKKVTNGIADIRKRVLKSSNSNDKIITESNSVFKINHGLSKDMEEHMSEIAFTVISSIGLDFGCVDFLVNKDNNQIKILETNSNPGIGDEPSLIEIYKTMLKHTILTKYKKKFPNFKFD